MHDHIERAVVVMILKQDKIHALEQNSSSLFFDAVRWI